MDARTPVTPSASSRARISPAALSVKVTARISSDRNAPVATWFATRCVIVVVLPGARAGEDADRPANRLDGAALLGVQPVENRLLGHRATLLGAAAGLSAAFAPKPCQVPQPRPAAAPAPSPTAARRPRASRPPRRAAPARRARPRARRRRRAGARARWIFGCAVSPTVSFSPQSSSCSFSPARTPMNSIAMSRSGSLPESRIMFSREVEDLHRLAHVEHEDLAAAADRAGLDHQRHGLRDRHEVARHLRVRDRHRAARWRSAA